jgi:hypothetical protein
VKFHVFSALKTPFTRLSVRCFVNTKRARQTVAGSFYNLFQGCFNNLLQAFRKMPMNFASKNNNNQEIDETPPPQPSSTVAVAPSLNMQTPARPVNIWRRVTHTADAPGNPHVTTPLDETKSQKKKRQNRIRAYNSRYRAQSEL